MYKLWWHQISSVLNFSSLFNDEKIGKKKCYQWLFYLGSNDEAFRFELWTLFSVEIKD